MNTTALSVGNVSHTIAAWIKLDSEILYDEEYLIADWDELYSHKDTALTVNQGRLCATSYGSRIECDIPSDSATVWHHVALTYGGSTYTIYLDGVEKANSYVDGGIDVADYPQQNDRASCSLRRQQFRKESYFGRRGLHNYSPFGNGSLA